MNVSLQRESDFLEVSTRMGLNKNLIQATGGNTSIKINDYMFVKASGQHLANASAINIFIKVYPRDYYYLQNNELKLNTSQKLFLAKDNLKPSIESHFHAILPKKVVLHSHSIDIIAHTMMNPFEKTARNTLYNINWQYINYVQPGVELAKKVYESMKPEHNIYILQNHGLIVCGDTAEEAEYLQNKVIKNLQLSRRKLAINKLDLLIDLVKYFPDLSLPASQIIHTLATDAWSLELANQNPYSPDHAVFCGIKPLVLTDINQDWAKLMKNHDYVIIEGHGVLLSTNASSYLEDMLVAQAEVFARIPVREKISTLSIDECNKLINWDAEKYRKKMIKRIKS